MLDKKKSLLLVGVLALSVGAATFSLFKGEISSFNNVEAVPYEIVISYNRNKFSSGFGYSDIYTQRGSKVQHYRSDITYDDVSQRVDLSNSSSFFGNLHPDGIFAGGDPVNGMTLMHFTDYSNIQVAYSWSATGGQTYYETPDASGNVYFSGTRPNYYRVQRQFTDEIAYLGSCTITFECVEGVAPGSGYTIKNKSIGQSYYGSDAVSFTYTRYIPDQGDTGYIPDGDADRPGNYLYMPLFTNLASASIELLHGIVFSVEFNDSYFGQTRYDNVHLDDVTISELEFAIDGRDDNIIQKCENNVSATFRFKKIAEISIDFTVFGYVSMSSLTHQVLGCEDIRQQENEELPSNTKVTFRTIVEYQGYFEKEDTWHTRKVGKTVFEHEVPLGDLSDFIYDDHPFTKLGDHIIRFKFDKEIYYDANYYVYDDAHIVKNVSDYTFPASVEAGTDLDDYVQNHTISANVKYRDGTSEILNFNTSNFDFSNVDVNETGLYFYDLLIGNNVPIKQFINIDLSDIGEVVEGKVYTSSVVSATVAVTTWLGPSYDTWSLKKVILHTNGYEADLEDIGENSHKVTGEYVEIKDNGNNIIGLVLYGALGALRVSISGSNIANYDYTDLDAGRTHYTTTSDSYLLQNLNVYLYNTEYHEMMVDYNSMYIRCKFYYVDEGHKNIYFKYPFGDSVLNLTATIDGESMVVDAPQII